MAFGHVEAAEMDDVALWKKKQTFDFQRSSIDISSDMMWYACTIFRDYKCIQKKIHLDLHSGEPTIGCQHVPLWQLENA